MILVPAERVPDYEVPADKSACQRRNHLNLSANTALTTKNHNSAWTCKFI